MASFQDPLPTEPATLAEPPPAPPVFPPARDPVWAGRDVLLLILVALFALIFCGIAIGLFVAAFHPKQKPEELAGMAVISILAQAFTSLAVFGAMYWMVVRRYRSPFWDAVRWRWPAGATGILCASGGVAVAMLVNFTSSFAPVPKSLPIYKLFETTTAAYAMAGYGILVAPVIEELFFRGFLYPVLARRKGVPLAVLLTSVAFMLIHASQLGGAWLPLLILFFVGLTFTLARAWSGSVAVPYLMHVAYNTTLFAGIFFSTGFFRHMDRLSQ